MLPIDQWADEFMASPANDLGRPGGPPEPAYGPPLLGYGAGDDPIWTEFKETVGPEHWTPLEAFNLAFPGQGGEAGDLSVISWVLPQTRATLREQRAAREFPGERWIRSRWRGQSEVVAGLGRFLLQKLEAAGLLALTPETRPEWQMLPSERFTYISRWSQRHVAFAAGLGSFGLCDGLITPVGKAMRAGSLVVRLKLPARPRPYTDPYEYCLFRHSGQCGLCIKRCPAGAISPAGHNKKMCESYLNKIASRTGALWPDLADKYGCGLCQTGVPCESRIPPRHKAPGL